MDYYPFKKYVSSVEELEEIIKRARNYRGLSAPTELFRGQARDGWQLKPSIAPSFSNSGDVKKTEKAILKDFLTELQSQNISNSIQSGYLNGSYHSEWLLIQQAQHYELPTRFMDWTGDWMVALFFAVSNRCEEEQKEDDRYNGQFWIFLVPEEIWISDGEPDDYINQDPFEYKETRVLNSSTLHSQDYLIQIAKRRKSKQKGRFCIQPYEDVMIPLEKQERYIPYLHMVIIPAKLKKATREHLEQLGMTWDSLYVNETLEEKEATEKVEIIVKLLKQKYFPTKKTCP